MTVAALGVGGPILRNKPPVVPRSVTTMTTAAHRQHRCAQLVLPCDAHDDRTARHGALVGAVVLTVIARG